MFSLADSIEMYLFQISFKDTWIEKKSIVFLSISEYFLQLCCLFLQLLLKLEETGLETEGILRVPGSASRVKVYAQASFPSSGPQTLCKIIQHSHKSRLHVNTDLCSSAFLLLPVKGQISSWEPINHRTFGLLLCFS